MKLMGVWAPEWQGMHIWTYETESQYKIPQGKESHYFSYGPVVIFSWEIEFVVYLDALPLRPQTR